MADVERHKMDAAFITQFLPENQPRARDFENAEDLRDYLMAIREGARRENVREPLWLAGVLNMDLSTFRYATDDV